MELAWKLLIYNFFLPGANETSSVGYFYNMVKYKQFWLRQCSEKDGTLTDFELPEDTPYLNLTSEVRGICFEYSVLSLYDDLASNLSHKAHQNLKT